MSRKIEKKLKDGINDFFAEYDIKTVDFEGHKLKIKKKDKMKQKRKQKQ